MFRIQAKANLLLLGLASLTLAPHTARAQAKPVLTTLHRFDSAAYRSEATLTLGTDGNLYGTTQNIATVFRMTPGGQYTTLYRFAYAKGSFPNGPLLQAQDGAFYGVAKLGGAHGYGSLYGVSIYGALTRLHSFGGAGGQYPVGKLVQDAAGNFYGVTIQGSAGYGDGVVYKMTPAGTVTVLHRFNGNDGYAPEAGVTLGPDGALYGTTSQGGRRGRGTIFRLMTDGSAFSVLHYLGSSDGGAAAAALVVGLDGGLYGTTPLGDVHSGGIAYKITTAGAFTVLHAFSTDGHGVYPNDLTLGADGNFYGTTAYGGAVNHGTVFVMTPAGELTTLYAFHTNFDGYTPFAGVAFGPSGALYGVTSQGGTHGYGTVYTLTLL